MVIDEDIEVVSGQELQRAREQISQIVSEFSLEASLFTGLAGFIAGRL